MKPFSHCFLHKPQKKTHSYSAKTMYNVISKYIPVEQIEHPDRRNYLEHLLRTKKELENIQHLELDEEEAKLKKEYVEFLNTITNDMFNWIKNKKTIEVNFWKYYF